MSIEILNFSSMPKEVGPYSYAVKHRGLIYFSGLTAVGIAAESSNINIQTKSIFTQLNGMLLELGCNLNNLIKVTIFITDMKNLNPLRNTLFGLYDEHIPASSAIGANELYQPKLLIEIEAIAAENKT